mgnify:CR=1 FL=1
MQVGDIVDGRNFTQTEYDAAAPVIIVNETFARKFGLGKDAVGRIDVPGNGILSNQPSIVAYYYYAQ